MAHLGSSRSDRAGFTLVEVIVVLAVVLMLTGIAVPLIGGYVEDGRRARAESEAKMLAAAILRTHKDLGDWPSRNGSGTPRTVYVLISGPSKPAANPWGTGGSFPTWAMSSTLGDLLDNHLLANTPMGQSGAAYATTGSARWRGPYLAGGSPVDPWGRPYVCNVLAGYNVHATNNKRVYVLSAGPDGIFQTSSDATATSDIAGDDIGLVVNQKR